MTARNSNIRRKMFLAKKAKDGTVQIKEGDQLIYSGDIKDAPKNAFIADLIRDALQTADGMAEREDSEGCLVTAMVFTNA